MQWGNIEVPQGPNTNVIVAVVVVVVDVQAARGEAPNNDQRTCTDVHPSHQSQKQHIYLPPSLELYLETRALYNSFSQDIGTKFHLDTRYPDS